MKNVGGSEAIVRYGRFSGTRKYASVQFLQRRVGVIRFAGIVGFVETWDVEPAVSVLL